MPRPRIERYWHDAREKIEREGRCRVCGSPIDVQAAHTVARKYDAKIVEPDGSIVRYADPDDIVPLCGDHHRAYDARALDLLPYMTRREQAAAVHHLGIARALRRLTSSRES